MNLRDTIKAVTMSHLQSGERLLGQCVTAVGWVNGTIPDMRSQIIDLPCTDVSASGIAAGIALAGGRPMLIIRFQDFLMLNSSCIVNFAAKQKLWGKTCPVFIRALSQEGKGTGATHSAKLHSVFMHFPGLQVCSPITPFEWLSCYDDFMRNDDPMLCCEYKSTFDNEIEYYDEYNGYADFTLIGIGNARPNMVRASEILRIVGVDCNVFHIHQLKPLQYGDRLEESIQLTKHGLVIDCGNDICGAGSWIAQKLGEKTGHIIHSMGIEDESCAVSEKRENATPSADKIVRKVLAIQ